MEGRFVTGVGGVLYPADTTTQDAVGKYGVGKPVLAKIKTQRNPKHASKYWAIMRLGYEHLNEHLAIENEEDLSYFIQFALAKNGYSVAGKFIPSLIGDVFIRASLSFSQMSQEAFEEYYAKAIPVLLTWLKGAGMELTLKELEDNYHHYQ